VILLYYSACIGGNGSVEGIAGLQDQMKRGSK